MSNGGGNVNYDSIWTGEFEESGDGEVDSQDVNIEVGLPFGWCFGSDRTGSGEETCAGDEKVDFLPFKLSLDLGESILDLVFIRSVNTISQNIGLCVKCLNRSFSLSENFGAATEDYEGAGSSCSDSFRDCKTDPC